MAMKPLPLRIEPSLRDRLAELAEVEGRPVSGLARDLLRQAVDSRLEFFYRKQDAENPVCETCSGQKARRIRQLKGALAVLGDEGSVHEG